ncbi:isochorismatase family protein [Acidisoma cellulosilytica]|uniref:Isochorismatase family protein n=1 Tax=Acidisoma cellulosilyticum TaxID=2802395 RepID=A0A963Z506_9PROT|nr:isochorismatase family protein [Acidisoma cellulosilyticum]MCB8881888.1 isochorismatase family protein [Acidisoma cellulosilyticum]
MPVTTLDKQTALILIDLQKGIVGLPLLHPIDGILAKARLLADAFRAKGLPVVLVNVDGSAPGRTERARPEQNWPEGWTDFVPEIDRRPSDIVVTKQTWGAFASTDLDARLKRLGVTQVVILGIATGGGVESTARQAYEQGFHVTLAIDAMTDRRAEAHDYCLAHVFPRLGETGTTQAIIDLLDTRNAS